MSVSGTLFRLLSMKQIAFDAQIRLMAIMNAYQNMTATSATLVGMNADNPVLQKMLEQKIAVLALIEKNLQQQQTRIQAELAAAEREVEGLQKTLATNIKSTFAYNSTS
jgi:hypothetical protein